MFLDEINVNTPTSILRTVTLTGDTSVTDSSPMAIHMDRNQNLLLWANNQALYTVTTQGVATKVGNLDHRPRALTYMHSFCSPCGKDCSGHGSCWDSICWCDAGWKGSNCELSGGGPQPTLGPNPNVPGESSSSAYPTLFWLLAVGCMGGGGYYWFRVRPRSEFQSMEESI